MKDVILLIKIWQHHNCYGTTVMTIKYWILLGLKTVQRLHSFSNNRAPKVLIGYGKLKIFAVKVINDIHYCYMCCKLL